LVARLDAELLAIEKGHIETDAARGVKHRVADDLAREERDDVVRVLAVP
jgi:hypothetical protein